MGQIDKFSKLSPEIALFVTVVVIAKTFQSALVRYFKEIACNSSFIWYTFPLVKQLPVVCPRMQRLLQHLSRNCKTRKYF